MSTHIINKPIGESPLKTVYKFKAELESQGKSVNKICCSGRLDPMAHGQLLVLVNEECKNIKIYNQKDKTYTFSFIVGISTDTTDILGLINDYNANITIDDMSNVTNIINTYNNLSYDQEYHIFSSNPVKGLDGRKRPLFYYGKNNIAVTVPKKMVNIYNMEVNKVEKINSLEEKVFGNLDLVDLDIRDNFRYSEIKECWKNYFKENKVEYYQWTCTAAVSSGTYIRQIVKDIGNQVSLPVMVTDLFRVKVQI
jgi:tRNA pseudouridine(55) synthase